MGAIRQRPAQRAGLTPAAEDFLKAVFKLARHGDRVSTTALAAELAISPPSATGMIKRLAAQGMLEHERYRGVTLTPEGRRAALEIVRHHRLLEAYLVERLGLDLGAAHAEACRLEHVLSEAVEARIADLLRHPARDPHGDPIPTVDLQLDDTETETLAEVGTGERCTIVRIPDGDAALVRYLDGRGLVPGATVTIVEAAPFDGPMTIEAETLSTALSRELAGKIDVDRGA